MPLFITPTGTTLSPISTGDGIPIDDTTARECCWDCYGPAITHEWQYRYLGSGNGWVIEFIWDKSPCKGKTKGTAHTNATRLTGTATWRIAIKANPHRYAILWGAG